MATDTVTSDKGIGLGVLLTVLALAAAGLMLAASPEATVGGVRTTAWGFAGAVTAGVVAVVAVHWFWG